MGYPNPKALSHLLKAAIGVEFTTKELDSIVYKQCELTNSKQKVAKALQERSMIPFDIISQDIIYIKDGLGGEKRVLHTIDDYTQIHFVFILYNNKLDSLIKYLKVITICVFRQYSLII